MNCQSNSHKNHSFSDEDLNGCNVVEHTVDCNKEQKTMSATDKHGQYNSVWLLYCLLVSDCCCKPLLSDIIIIIIIIIIIT